jgi:hypothetical protein
MSNLSPAAQAVLDAFHNAPVVGGPHGGDALGLAAALCAAADQMHRGKAKLHAIAAELEGES